MPGIFFVDEKRPLRLSSAIMTRASRQTDRYTIKSASDHRTPDRKPWHDCPKENFAALLLTVAAIAVNAYRHKLTTSPKTTRGRFIPWILIACVYFGYHILIASLSVYREQRLPLAKGGRSIPLWRFRRGLYVATVLYVVMPTIVAVVAIQKASIGDITALPALPEPVLYLQPDTAVRDEKTTNFALALVNSGPDIDYIGFRYDYFIAWKSGQQLVIYQTLRVAEGAAATARPLRTNQSRRIEFSFAGMTPAIYRYIISRHHPALPGVRITITFRRYLDGKAYTRSWSYGARGRADEDNFDLIWSPESSMDLAPLPGVTEITMRELASDLESDKYWTQPIFRLFQGKVSIAPDSPPPVP